MTNEQKGYIQGFLAAEIDRQCAIAAKTEVGTSKHVAALWRRDALRGACAQFAPDLVPLFQDVDASGSSRSGDGG